MPRQQACGNGFNTTNRPPNAGHSMAPNRDGITESRKGDVVHQIILMRLMQPLDHLAGRALPKQIVPLKVSFSEKASGEKRQKDSRSPKPVGIRVAPPRAKRLGLRLSFCRFYSAGL